MDNEIDLTITFNGKELSFPMRLLNYGNSYKLEMMVDDTKVLFEPDEERNWRAMISYEEAAPDKSISRELLQTIAAAIEEALK